MATDITVCVPWRPTPDRTNAFNRITDFWTHFGFKIVTADSDPNKPFNTSQARNRAVTQAKTDHIIITDADVIIDIANAYTAQQNPADVTYLFTRYRHIPNQWAHKADLLSAPTTKTYANSPAAIFATTTQIYWQLGGFDEHFKTWGYEDDAFRAAAQTLSTTQRLPGYAFSFDHHADRDTTNNNPNLARYALYQFAAGHPDIMTELIKT